MRAREMRRKTADLALSLCAGVAAAAMLMGATVCATAARAAVSDPAAPFDPGADPAGAAHAIVGAVQSHRWGLAVSILVLVAVWLLRVFGGRRWPVLTSNRAGALLGLVASVLGSLVTTAVAGEPVDVELVVGVLVSWWVAAGGQSTVKDLLAGSWEPRAKAPTVPAPETVQ